MHAAGRRAILARVSLLQDPPRSLRAVLEHCARRVPAYRGIEPPRAGESDAQALARFPLLDKAGLRRAFPHGFVPAGEALPELLRTGELALVGTSGTSGERVQVLWHQPWWDAQEVDGFAAHARAGALVAREGYREAVLTTPVCSGNLCHVGALPMQERIEGGRTLFLNQSVDPGRWSDAEVLRMADELERFAPDALEADPAYLAYFAVRLVALGRRPAEPKFIDLSYEFPSRRHLAAIARAFAAPCIDAYGSTECGFVFCECEQGRLHHNAAWSHVEFVPVEELPGVARLVLTPLGNPWLNLVRFETGDLVRPAREACPCGMRGTTLEAIEGRAQDAVADADGRLLTLREIDRALAPVPGLLNYRLVQRGAREAELELVGDGCAQLDLDAARAALGARLGFEPRVRRTSSLPVEASGKFRLARAEHFDAAARVRGAR